MAEKTVRIGVHRGRLRLWLEGLWLAEAGFTSGRSFVVMTKGRTVSLHAVDHVVDGEVSRKVSKKEKHGWPVPVIDINAAVLNGLVEGPATVTVRQGVIKVVQQWLTCAAKPVSASATRAAGVGARGRSARAGGCRGSGQRPASVRQRPRRTKSKGGE